MVSCSPVSASSHLRCATGKKFVPLHAKQVKGRVRHHNAVALCSRGEWPATSTLPHGARRVSLHFCELFWVKRRWLILKVPPSCMQPCSAHALWRAA